MFLIVSYIVKQIEADHSGYCSDNECEDVETVLKLDFNVSDERVVEFFKETDDLDVLSNSIIALCPEYGYSLSFDSGYCAPSKSGLHHEGCHTLLDLKGFRFSNTLCPRIAFDPKFICKEIGYFAPHLSWYNQHAKHTVFEFRIQRFLLIQNRLCPQMPKDVKYLIIQNLILK